MDSMKRSSLALVLTLILLHTGSVYGNYHPDHVPDLPLKFAFLAKISYKPLTPRARFARCTATVYNELWLITSVRCAIPSLRRQNGNPTHDWGDVDFEGADHTKTMCRTGDPSNYRFITEVHVPPGANTTLGGSLNNINTDIALLKLSKPLTFSRKVRPLPIATNLSQCLQPERATFLGWGVKTTVDGQLLLSDEQHMMQLKILPVPECSAKVRGFMGDARLCAVSFDASDRSCYSDTGGPLIVTKMRKKYPEGTLVEGNLLCGILPISTCSRGDNVGDTWVEYFTKAYIWSNWIRSIAGRGFRNA